MIGFEARESCLARRALFEHRKAQLGAKTRSEVQRVATRVRLTAREVQLRKLRIDVVQIRDRREHLALQCLHRHGVFQIGPHRVSVLTLRVGDQHIAHVTVEGGAERVHLRLAAATPGWRVGFVRNEEGRARERCSVHAFALHHLIDEVANVLCDALRIEAGTVKRAVRRLRMDELGQWLDASGPGARLAFDHESGRPGPEDQSIAFRTEGNRCLLDFFFRRGRARREETGADGGKHPFARHVVRANDDHTVTAAEPQPVMGSGDRQRPARAGRIDQEIRAARRDHLGELGVCHREGPKQELARELVELALFLQLGEHRLGSTTDRLALRRVLEPLAHAIDQVFELLLGSSRELRGDVSRSILDHPVCRRERSPDDDTGPAGERIRESPALRQSLSGGGGFVVADHRDPRVTECLDARCDRHSADLVEGFIEGLVDAVGLDDVELPEGRGELNDVRELLEAREVTARFVQTHDVPVDHRLAHRIGDRSDQVLTAQHPIERAHGVIVVEHRIGGRQERHTGDDGVFRGRWSFESFETRLAALLRTNGRGLVFTNGGRPFLETYGWAPRCRQGERVGLARGEVDLDPFAREHGERIHQGLNRGSFVVVRGDRLVLAVVAEHVAHKAGGRTAWATLDEHPRPLRVHVLDLRDELHRRLELLAEQVDDRRLRVGVVARVHVRQNRDLRCLDVQSAKRVLERDTGWRDDRAVERVRNRDLPSVDPRSRELLDRGFDRARVAGDHGLSVAILVGGNDVALDALEHRLNLVRAGGDGRHLAIVLDLDVSHLAPARTDRVERLRECHHSRSDARCVLAERMAHDHRRSETEGAEQAKHRDVRREHRRLADLGLSQTQLGCFTLLVGLRLGPGECRERRSDQGLENSVCLLESLPNHREELREVFVHPQELRSLAREQKCDRALRGE